MLPFTRTQFIAVFVEHNLDVWPLQIAAALLTLPMVVWLLVATPTRDGGRMVAAGLAALWLATAIGYHGMHFAAINPLAWAFGTLFAAQGLLLLHAGVIRAHLGFGNARGMRAAAGWALVAYAMVGYPALGLALGARWDELPAFGLTPCPLTLFTIGMLLLANPPLPRALLAVPLLWSVIGGSAALLLGMPQDLALPLAAIALVAAVRYDSQRPSIRAVAHSASA
jgi:hypothetical protein